MVLSRKSFQYHDRKLIEQVIIAPPFRHEAIFQNEACFLHISGDNATFLTDNQATNIHSNEAVLLKCGRYFVDWLKASTDDKKIEIIAIHLYPEVLKKLYEHELPTTIKQRISENRITSIIPDNALAKFVENLTFYFENPMLVNDDLLELKIRELILLLIQSKNAESVHQLLSDLFSPRKAVLREVVSTHLYSNLSHKEMAKLCNLSLSTFKREFKSVFSVTPANYILTKKLEKAYELLKVSNQSISDIAYDAGFNDPSYFSRVFKNRFGLSPTQFRANRNEVN